MNMTTNSAAESGFPPAQLSLGLIHLQGLTGTQNLALAVRWLGAAAEAREPLAQFTLAGLYANGEGVARDLREALFLKIQRYSHENLDQQKTGQLLVRLTSDVNAVKTLTQVSLRIGTRAPLLMLGSLALMITTSRALALTMLPLLLVTSLVPVLWTFALLTVGGYLAWTLDPPPQLVFARRYLWITTAFVLVAMLARAAFDLAAPLLGPWSSP